MRRLLIAPAAGLALGAVDSIVNHVPVWRGEVGLARADRGGWSQVSEFASLILDAGWAWAAVAVLVGWLVRGLWQAAVAGALTLACATVAYYAMDVVFDGGAWWGMATEFWLIGSVVLGPFLGVAGALIRRRDALGTVAALVVPVGAALQMVLLPPPPDSLMAVPVRFSVWLAAAVAAVLVVRSARARAASLGGDGRS